MNWKTLPDQSERLLRKILFPHHQEFAEEEYGEKMFKKSMEKGYFQRKIEEQQSFDYLKAWEKTVSQKKSRGERALLMKIAALVVCCIGVASICWWYSRSFVFREEPLSVVQIVPGTHKAILIKHDGETLKLGKDSLLVQESDLLKIQVDSAGILYQAKPKENFWEELMHTLVVPRGGEYALTLSDSTQVWLNAGSELRFPVCFNGTVREVYLSGEAYFAVKEQQKSPFVVKTTRGRIVVLGTEFSVQDYPDSDNTRTILVQGKVRYDLPNGREITLQPNQQLLVNDLGDVVVKEVDVYCETCWKDGMFVFREKRLEDIMKQLERWYDFHIFYTDDAVKNLHFSGDLSRFKTMNTFIEIFEQSAEVQFEIHGNNIFVGVKK